MIHPRARRGRGEQSLERDPRYAAFLKQRVFAWVADHHAMHVRSVRTVTKAFLKGSISRLSTQYVVGLEAMNCTAQLVLAKFQQLGERANRTMAVQPMSIGAAGARSLPPRPRRD
jgi:hypothetical protein